MIFVNRRPSSSLDADAAAYIAAVESADGQALEAGIKDAINAFVGGCKADGIWTAIKAACILAGARTLAGALVPLVGSAPTNVGPFVSGDYNRKTGLLGNGSTKYLNTNRNNNADPQNDKSLGVFVHTTGSNNVAFCGAGTNTTGSTNLGIASGGTTAFFRINMAGSFAPASGTGTGLYGASRTASNATNSRGGGTTGSDTTASSTPVNGNIFIFGRNASGVLSQPSNGRLRFYWVGTSLTLSSLESRLSTLFGVYDSLLP